MPGSCELPGLFFVRVDRSVQPVRVGLAAIAPGC